MKKKIIALLLLLTVLLVGCGGNDVKIDLEDSKDGELTDTLDKEELKRVNLYVKVMKSAFEEENGGKGFIAVKLDSLEGLSDEGKKEVLKELESISENVYDFEVVKNDDSKFDTDEDGRLRRSIDGTLLSVTLEEYKRNKAIIEATSWFGNLGAVFPKYKAKYKNGEWNLELISMAIS